MPVNRRGILKGIGAASIGGSAILGSGALTQISSARTVSVDVTNDSSSTLSLSAGDAADGIGDISETDGQLSFTLSNINADSQLVIGDAPSADPASDTISSAAFEITDNASYDDSDIATGVEVSVSATGASSGLGMIFLPTGATDDLALDGADGYTSSDQDSVTGANLQSRGTDISAIPSRYVTDGSPDSDPAKFLLDEQSTVGAEMLLQADADDLDANPSFDITITAETVDTGFTEQSLTLTDKDGNDITSTQPYTVPVGTPTVTVSNTTGYALDSLEIVNNNTGSSELETAYDTTFDATTSNSATINSVPAGTTERIDVDNTGTTATTVTLDIIASRSGATITESVDITLPGGVEGAVDDLFNMDVGKSASIEVLGDITVDTNDTPPVADKAFAFPSDAMSDGEDTVIKMKDVPKMADTTNAMTVSVWAKSGTPAWPSNGLPAARRNEFMMHSDGDSDTIGWYTGTGGDHNEIYESTGSEISGYDLQNWHMYTLTQTENSYALYIDDVQIDSGSKSDWSYQLPDNTSGNVEAGDVFFGKDSGYEPDRREFTDGKIGPASFYDRVLSESEVSNLFSNGSP